MYLLWHERKSNRYSTAEYIPGFFSPLISARLNDYNQFNVEPHLLPIKHVFYLQKTYNKKNGILIKVKDVNLLVNEKATEC